jgi:hypothetical protein
MFGQKRSRTGPSVVGEGDFGVPAGLDRLQKTDSGSSHQLPSREEQVAEDEQGEELRAVLREAAIAGRELPELALGHPERVLDARAPGR